MRLVTATVIAAAFVVGHHLTSASGDREPAIMHGATDQVIVDANSVERTIPSGFFGINYVGFWDNAAGSRASAMALAQTPIRTVRFPGGAPADWYNWQDPYYHGWSHTSPMKLWHYAGSFGARHVVFGTNYQGHQPNPSGKPYAVNSPQNAAAWVKYDKKAGINAAMEVGNEEDLNLLHKTDDPAYAAYTARFNAQARAMHKANPHVRVLGPVGTNEYYWWGMDGLGQFLRGAGNRTGTSQVDGIALHFYKGNNWLEAKGVAQYWTSHDGPWAAIQRITRAHDTRNLPVYITEWNVGGADQHSAFNPTLGHALVNADMLGAMALSGVAGEDYFDTHGGSTWGLLYGLSENRPLESPTPTYYALALWKQMGSRMVAVQQSDDPGSATSAYATTGRGGSMQVLLINKQSSSRTVTVAFQGASPAGHRLRIYSLRGNRGTIDDHNARYNGVTMPSPQSRLPSPRDAGLVKGRTLSYSVPGYSAVVLSLGGTTRDPRIRWHAGVASTPAPAAEFKLQSKIGHAVIRRGETQIIAATVRNTQDVGSILVDLEVYDSANAKVFQYSKVVDLSASRPVTVTESYRLAATARTGNYHYKIGVFGPNWSPLYVWQDDAGAFTVAK